LIQEVYERGIAPLLLGQIEFAANANIIGTVLNQVRDSRHEKNLRDVIEGYTNISVLGLIPQPKDL